MAHYPVYFSDSTLALHRSDYHSLFGNDAPVVQETARIQIGDAALTVTVTLSDSNALRLTPQDSFRLKLNPSILTSAPTSDFLKIVVMVHARGKETRFNGTLQLIERELLLQKHEMTQLKLIPGQVVFLAARKGRDTIFGGVRVIEVSGANRARIPRDEAQGALLQENDLLYLTGLGTPNSIPVSETPTLPERFLSLDMKPGKNGTSWITEKDVWQAILKHKKIWVPKNARLTPAAADLGKSHRIFEFEA